MTGSPAAVSPTGTTDVRYLVYAPGTTPLGQPTDMRIIDAYKTVYPDGWMILLIRLSNPTAAPEPADAWARVKITPSQPPQDLGDSRRKCIGTAVLMRPDGTDDGNEYTFVATFTVADRDPQDQIGELVLSR